MKDWFLLLIIGVVVAIDLLIVTIGTTIPSSRIEGGDKESDKEQFDHVTVSVAVIFI